MRRRHLDWNFAQDADRAEGVIVRVVAWAYLAHTPFASQHFIFPEAAWFHWPILKTHLSQSGMSRQTVDNPASHASFASIGQPLRLRPSPAQGRRR